MGPLRELLAIDHRRVLAFFVLRLQDVSELSVDREEVLYNASLLADYAQVSTQPDADVPAPANLSVTSTEKCCTRSPNWLLAEVCELKRGKHSTRRSLKPSSADKDASTCGCCRDRNSVELTV